VRNRQLFRGRVPAFDVIDSLEKIRIIPESASHSAQTADVLGMIPACVMAAAVGVRNERDSHWTL
jgi:hypothetical protein